MPEKPSRDRPGRGDVRPSPATLGLVRVGDDFEREYPDADRSSTEALASLVRAGNALLYEFTRSIAATLGVSEAAATALAVIEGADAPLTPSQISERVLVPSATMTATLDLLERKGWVVRQPNDADRRSVLIAITDEGRDAADRLLRNVRVVEATLMSALSERERLQLLRSLDKILTKAAAVAEGPPIVEAGRRRRPTRKTH